jgi:hypothetical protein
VHSVQSDDSGWAVVEMMAGKVALARTPDEIASARIVDRETLAILAGLDWKAVNLQLRAPDEGAGERQFHRPSVSAFDESDEDGQDDEEGEACPAAAEGWTLPRAEPLFASRHAPSRELHCRADKHLPPGPS